MTAPLTPSQTVGPFFALGLPWADGPHVVPPGTPEAFWLRGRVLDGAGEPVPDALVESWQADPHGRFDHPDDPRGGSGLAGGWRGFGRCPTDDGGRWGIYTVRPGRLPAVDGRRHAPQLNLSIFARGLLDRVVTRVYLPDEPAANAEDPVLATVDAARRGTLIAAPAEDGYTFDIRLQAGPDGAGETVFFDV